MATPVWYCCQQLVERTVIAVIAPVMMVTPGFIYPEPLFDPFWSAVTQSRNARKAAFLEVFGLRIVTIGEPHERYVQVLPEYVPFWLSAAVFVLLPAQGCSDGCERFEFQ